ncbi:MAG: HAD family phosphatase, partial [Planctomycetota bacterium]|nr:HAD family phosphatase [Planctomycetota bacterium]
MAIRCIIFDMGRVLVHFSHDEMFAAMGRVCGATGQQIREWLWDSGLEDRFERGEIDAAGVRDELQRQVETEIDVADLMRAASDIFTL